MQGEVEGAPRLFIHAPNVHQGGGRVLLEALLREVPIGTEVVLDKRMVLSEDLHSRIRAKFVPPTLFHRFSAEKWIAKRASPQDTIVCFGNLPPLFKTKGHIVVFLQNRYLVDEVSLSGFPVRVRFRLEMERFWLRITFRRVSKFVVQTPTMLAKLAKRVGKQVPICICAFASSPRAGENDDQSMVSSEKAQYDFLYVASGEPHKNHRNLIEAWCLLASEGVYPSLCLTLDDKAFPSLCAWIENMKGRNKLNVANIGVLPHAEIARRYRQSGALIFPSKFESFGLPILEASNAGLPILASELDFVRDLLDPEQTFDPDSAISIARAVKRFIGLPPKRYALVDAADFLACVADR